jgi:hypothetical protein
VRETIKVKEKKLRAYQTSWERRIKAKKEREAEERRKKSRGMERLAEERRKKAWRSHGLKRAYVPVRDIFSG